MYKSRSIMNLHYGMILCIVHRASVIGTWDYVRSASSPPFLLFAVPSLCIYQLENKGTVYTLSCRVCRYIRQ